MSQPAPDPAPSVVATVPPLASPSSTASAVPHNLTAAAPEHPRNASALPPGMPTQAGPTISLNLQTLRGVVQSLERLEDRVDQLDVQGRQAAEKSNGENLEEMLNIRLEVTDADGADREGAVVGEVGVGLGEVVEETELEKSARISHQYASTNAIKIVLNRAFAKQLGIPDTSFKVPSLPNYPKEGDDWPTVPGSNVRCMRFAWDSVHSLVNQENITKIMEYVRAHGAELVPEAGSLLPSINDYDLNERITKKVKYLISRRKELEKANATTSASQLGKRSAPADAGTDEGAVVDPALMEEGQACDAGDATPGCPSVPSSRATKYSRMHWHLEQRLRKRPTSAYADPKFDQAFTLAAMSEAEEEPATSTMPRRFIHRAPDYRSDLAVALYENVDAQTDPDPGKAQPGVPRVRGPVLPDFPPPRTKTAKTRVPEWMVRPELLDKNPHWKTTGLVRVNGILWGDQQDPVADEEKAVEQSIADKAVLASRKRAKTVRMDGSQVSESRKKGEELLAGQSVDELFM